MKKLIDCFRKIKMKYCGISVILALIFVCLVQEKVSAAEMLYKPYDSARWNGEYVKYNPELAKKMLMDADFQFDKKLVLTRYSMDDLSEKLLEEIREIRLSERRFYQKVTDIYLNQKPFCFSFFNESICFT